MKPNTIKVTAIYLLIALGGFLLGKLATGKAELSEIDLLIEKSERLTHQRTDSSNRENTNHPNRPTQQLDNKTLDKKLANLEIIVSNQNALDRGRAMLDWIDTLAPEEFEAAVDDLRRLGLNNNKLAEYTMMVLAAWAEVDPAAALAYTTTETPSGDTENKDESFDLIGSKFLSGEATSNVLSAWATNDPEAAIAWAKSHHQGDEANPYMFGIIRGIAESDPARATAMLQDLPYGVVRGTALLSMMPHVMEMGPESAEKWIAEINDERLRKGAIARYSETIANQDPAGAASYLLNNVSDRSMASVYYVFSEWAKVDSAAAIANLESIPDADVRTLALNGLVKGLGFNNPQSIELRNRFQGEANEQK
ncbi:MAG: hypothetical protein V4727_00560 [Verrucomicrobiota bacterium]